MAAIAALNRAVEQGAHGLRTTSSGASKRATEKERLHSSAKAAEGIARMAKLADAADLKSASKAAILL
ncbi:MAG: hypothetical protein WBE72_00370 [Terracidiphilus sp.]